VALDRKVTEEAYPKRLAHHAVDVKRWIANSCSDHCQRLSLETQINIFLFGVWIAVLAEPSSPSLALTLSFLQLPSRSIIRSCRTEHFRFQLFAWWAPM